MKTYVYVECWVEDYENHGKNIQLVSNELVHSVNFSCDEVEVWEDGQRIEVLGWNSTKGIFD